APRRCGRRRRAFIASASDAGTRRARRGKPARRRKSYCARRRVRLSTTWHDFLEALVRAGAFPFRELLLWVVMPLPHLVPLERPPQPELDFRAQRAHLPPRLCGQHLSQIILEADRKAPILIRVVSHRKSSSWLAPRRRLAGNRRLHASTKNRDLVETYRVADLTARAKASSPPLWYFAGERLAALRSRRVVWKASTSAGTGTRPSTARSYQE